MNRAEYWALIMLYPEDMNEIAEQVWGELIEKGPKR